MSVNSETALAAETHRAEGQWPEEQENVVKLRMFRAGTLIADSFEDRGQYLAPLRYRRLLKTNRQSNDA
jgi:hypothetical protein